MCSHSRELTTGHRYRAVAWYSQRTFPRDLALYGDWCHAGAQRKSTGLRTRLEENCALKSWGRQGKDSILLITVLYQPFCLCCLM